MARRTNDTFLDKFLGVFGITRPKRRKTVSNRRTNLSKNDSNNRTDKLSVNDDFLIVSSEPKENRTTSNKTQSSRSANAKKSNIKSSSKKKGKAKTNKKKIPTALLVVVIVISVIFFSGLAWLNNGNYMLVDSNETSINLHDLKLEFTSVLYAKNSEGEYVELTRLQSEQNRLWVDYEDVPEHLVNAYISCEDKTFRTHSGVNWKRSISATANLVFKFYESEQGGSTITQQLIKNVTNDNAHDW